MCDRELRIPLDFDMDPVPLAIIPACLHPDPSKRPDMKTILQCLMEWEKRIQSEGFGKEVVNITKDMFADALLTLTGRK